MTTIVRRRKLGMTSVKGICEASTTGIQWCRNGLGIPEDDVYIRWGCTANLPRRAKVINKAGAIHQVNDKAGFRATLNEHGLCPKTWFSPANVPAEALMSGVIVRPNRHAQGRNIHLVHDRDELDALQRRYGEIYISEYIRKVEEYRVFVAQGRAVWVAKKTPADPDALAWNVAKGGRFDNVRWGDWPLKAVKKSIEAFNLTELDFGGVDVMVDGQGEVYIIEINSAPSQTSPYRISCVAKAFDYMIGNGTDRIPLTQERGGWRKFIHPAVSEEAIIPEQEVEQEVAEIRQRQREQFVQQAMDLPDMNLLDDLVERYLQLDQNMKRQFIQRII